MAPVEESMSRRPEIQAIKVNQGEVGNWEGFTQRHEGTKIGIGKRKVAETQGFMNGDL